MEKYPLYPAKRAFDIIFSLAILILCAPLFIFFTCAIFLEHLIRLRPFDPLLYSEVRYSHGDPFTLYKFNIFKQDVIEGMRARGEFIYTKQLERNGSILSVGWVLKQIYLDELPQFFNILKGDMSVVGPRPVNREVFQKLLALGITDKVKVKAGLTGYYQSHKHTAGKRSDDLDRDYVEYYRIHAWYAVLLFDIKILLRTIKILLLARGV